MYSSSHTGEGDAASRHSRAPSHSRAGGNPDPGPHALDSPEADAASRHSRAGGNPGHTPHALDSRLRGNDGTGDATANDSAAYIPFDGIVLTDTFQLYEPRGDIIELAFPENNQRVKRQKAAPIRVVIANPPYSAQQESENDDNKNLRYPHLDDRIRTTYGKRSTGKLLKNLYSSEIRALRWATDRLADRGIVAFVTNNAFVDKGAMDGVRACLTEDFASIFVFNLRGYQRTAGETSRMEGGKIFGSGSRNGIAIALFVKNRSKQRQTNIYYHDIGDYLSREAKLRIIQDFRSKDGMVKADRWNLVTPNPEHDWINQRDPGFQAFTVLASKGKNVGLTVFETSSFGVITNRDAWVYNASRASLIANVRRLIAKYRTELKKYQDACEGEPNDRLPRVEEIVDSDPKQISWTRSLKADIARGKPLSFEAAAVTKALYRPFAKQWIYFQRRLNEMVSLTTRLFPTEKQRNLAICTTGVGSRDAFGALITDVLPDMHMADKSGASQCFPLYLYERADGDNELYTADGEVIDGYRRRDAITDAIHKTFREAYGPQVSKEDIFYYVYGVLHSPEYRRRFAADLKKMLPRIPLTKETKDFRAFSQAGRDLAKWHLNYETVEPYAVVEHSTAMAFDDEHFKVQKMQFGRADKAIDKSTIVFNSQITIKGIPLSAYDYVVNGKPAIEWIMERYQVTRDKDSGIVNDPNDWAKEHNQPRYIIDLLKRVITVSMETNKIVAGLPGLNERKPDRQEHGG